MIKMITNVIWSLVFLNSTLVAKDLSNLYTRSDLKYWQGRFSDNIRWNFNNLIFVNLTANEKRLVGRVKLHLPLSAFCLQG